MFSTTMMIVLLAMTRPKVLAEELPLFQQLVARARRFQHGTLTHRQYQLLERVFLNANEPVTSPLFGWYYATRQLLRRGIADAGIAVRPDRPSRLHSYKLTRVGFHRLTELEQKIFSSR